MCDIKVTACFLIGTLIKEVDCRCFTGSPLLDRMHAVGLALEELLVTAQKQDCLTVGIYESAKHLNT